MALCDLEDPGLVVLPTHRILRDLDVRRVAELEQSLSPYFQIEPLSGDLSAAELLALLAASRGDTPAAVLARSSDALLVTEKPAGREAMDHLEGEYAGVSAAWRQLDLAVLHELVLRRGLDISPEMVRAGEHISYTREAGAAVAAAREADTHEDTLALLVRPTPPTAIRDVARAGERMPQKSTYFYPKLITGLVINPLW
jgi:hypothetical protein